MGQVLQFPDSQRSADTVLTGGVQPLPSPNTLAAFRYNIGEGLTPAEQHLAVKKVVERGLSDAAIAGGASCEPDRFHLGYESLELDPNYYDTLDPRHEAGASAQVVDMAQWQVEHAEQLVHIIESIRRAGPRIVYERVLYSRGDPKREAA